MLLCTGSRRSGPKGKYSDLSDLSVDHQLPPVALPKRGLLLPGPWKNQGLGTAMKFRGFEDRGFVVSQVGFL